MQAHQDFEWDDAKAQGNVVKHGVEFSYATRVFLDPWRIDMDVSRTEERESRRKTIGLIQGRLFTVVYTVRGETTRIISARRCDTTESKVYGPFHA
jgi:uncharacterized DUF497 family protein